MTQPQPHKNHPIRFRNKNKRQALQLFLDGIMWLYDKYSNIYWNYNDLAKACGYTNQTPQNHIKHTIKEDMEDAIDQMYLNGYKDGDPEGQVENEINQNKHRWRTQLYKAPNHQIPNDIEHWAVNNYYQSNTDGLTTVHDDPIDGNYQDTTKLFKQYRNKQKSNHLTEHQLSKYAYYYDNPDDNQNLLHIIVMYPLGITNN